MSESDVAQSPIERRWRAVIFEEANAVFDKPFCQRVDEFIRQPSLPTGKFLCQGRESSTKAGIGTVNIGRACADAFDIGNVDLDVGNVGLDVARLGRTGALQPWHRSVVNWASDGQPIGSIGLLALAEGLQLSGWEAKAVPQRAAEAR